MQSSIRFRDFLSHPALIRRGGHSNQTLSAVESFTTRAVEESGQRSDYKFNNHVKQKRDDQ